MCQDLFTVLILLGMRSVIGQAQWLTLVIPSVWEAMVGTSFKVRI